MVRIGHSPDLPVGSDTQGIPKLPALPTQALRLLKSTHRVTKVTALGGGHGLYGSLSALRHVTTDLTAVVTVADDGGSSGRLRKEMGVLPPGDLRMALSALCDDTDWGRTWRDVMQHRFSAPEGYNDEFPLEYHALGNLLITTLWQLLEDPVAGLDWAGALLNARGRVLPMALDPMVIYGTVLREHAGGGIERVRISGQVNLSKEKQVHDIGLTPKDARPCPEALTAIEESDWVILGPGSWRTSVLPHLLLEAQRDVICRTEAMRCVVMNLSDDEETAGFTPAAHLALLKRYAPDLRLDAVIADDETPKSVRSELERESESMGARVMWAPVRASAENNVHNPLKLAAAYHELFSFKF